MPWVQLGSAALGAGLGSQTGSSSGPPRWIKRPSRDLVNRAVGFSNRDYVGYSGPRVAQMSEAERQYGRGALASGRALEGYAGRAGQSWADTDQSRYMDPYAEMAIQPSLRRRAEEGGRMRENLRSTAVSRGAFGGDRATLLEAANERDTQQGLDDLYYGGMSDAYRFGAGQFGQDQDRLLRAGQVADDAMARYGALDRGLDQAQRDVDYAAFLEERDWGPNQMQWLMQALGAAQGGTQSSGAPAAGALGGAITGYQLGGMFRPPSGGGYDFGGNYNLDLDYTVPTTGFGGGWGGG